MFTDARCRILLEPMHYREALEFIYGFVNYEKIQPVSYSSDTLNLDRMRTLLAALGNPEKRYKTVHVAGTKGKGSTSAMMESVLRHMGLKVGLYVSPHLSTFRERMQVNRELIPAERVGDLADEIKAAVMHKVQVEETIGEGDAAEKRMVEREEYKIPGITFFEVITAMAFLHFAREQVDWAVIEVGLGGRLDATNVITPEVSLITSLSLDHMHLLGNTLGEIAREKAGIIKPGVPVVVESQTLEATQVIEKIASDIGAPFTQLGRHWRWTPGTNALNKQAFEVKQVSLIRSKNRPFVNDLEGWYEIQLMGKHQLDNATLVIAAIDVLRESLRASGVQEISAKIVRDGLRQTLWAGRFDIVRGDPPLVMDGAHNVDSVNKLLITLVELFPGKRWTFIFGTYKDKDADGMLKQLSGRAIRFIFVQAEKNPRALPVDELLALAQKRNLRATGLPNITDAIDAVANLNEAVCITGSLAVVGEARIKWALKMGAHLPETD